MDSSNTNQEPAEAADVSSEMTVPEETTPADDRPNLEHDDVVPEILYRLAPKYVLRSKLVSKSWHEMVSHPSFAPQHTKLRDAKQGAVCGLLFFQWLFWVRHIALTYFEDGGRRWINGAQLSAGDWREQNYSVTNTCRGMVCVVGAIVDFLINPSIEEAVRLPGGAMPHFDLSDQTPPAGGLVFDESTGRYVVVRVFGREDWSNGCEVLTIGHDDAWRPVEDPPIPVSPKAPPVFAGGLLLWLMNDSSVDDDDLGDLIAFDPKKEAFFLIDLPEGCRAFTCCTGIVELDGQLCYWERNAYERSLIIWVSTSKSNDFEWQELLCIRDLIYERSSLWDPEDADCTWAPVASWNGKIILSNGRAQIVYYDRKSKSFDPVTSDVPYGRAISYYGTLISPKALLQKPADAGEGGQAVQPVQLPMVTYPNIWGGEVDGAADGMPSSSRGAKKKKKEKVEDISWYNDQTVSIPFEIYKRWL